MRKYPFRFIIVSLTALLLLAAPACRRQSRPNVVVIVIDTLRADRLSFYGYPRNTTPFLNSLAPQSSVFTKAYAGSSWTAPATASIFTGLYPFQHGVIMGLLAQKRLIRKDPSIKINRIPETVQTLPEVFKAAGYRTFGISDNANISPRQGFQQGFDKLLNFSHRGARLINQKLLELEKEIRAAPRYFLYIHYNDPHRPYKLKLNEEQRSLQRVRDLKRVYDLEVDLVDRSIKELYWRLGWNRDTLIVVTADHGEEMMERGFYGHGKSLYNTVIHVPLLFYYPGSRAVAPGRIASPVSNLDILPTLIKILGLSRLDDLAGKDLSPQLRDPRAVPKAHPIYSHLQLQRAGQPDFVSKATVFGDFKFIYQSGDESSLFFDLKSDPQELSNLYARSQRHARQLAASFFNFERSCRRFNPEYVGIQLDKKSIEHLKSLGYIQ